MVKAHGNKEDRVGDLRSCREANHQMNWQFLLLQDAKRDWHAGLAMAPLSTKDTYPCVQHHTACLRELLSYAINKPCAAETRSCIENRIASREVHGTSMSERGSLLQAIQVVKRRHQPERADRRAMCYMGTFIYLPNRRIRCTLDLVTSL